MKYCFLVFVVALLSPISYGLDCVGIQVDAIQALKSNVLVHIIKPGEWGAWKNLGAYDQPHLVSYQSIAQQALATGASIRLRFENDHVCSETDYGTVPYMIRIED